MFDDWFATLEVVCDAPSYPIVQACRNLGFHTPEDVRWCNANHARPSPKQRERMLVRVLKSLFRMTEPRRAGCVCRQQLPHLHVYTFTLASGDVRHLVLGQCRGCWTIYWKTE